jgi:Transposase Tn5 dimerisation domain/Transposase DNA-binding
MQSWIEEELRTADLKDKRLDRRFKCVLDRLSQKPSLKFNAACRGSAEVKGAYSFVNNKHVTAQAVLAPHHDATLQRIRSFPVVILSQDTSEADLTRPKERIRGGGPLNDADRIGFHFHNLLAVTPERLPLGTVASTIWARDPEEFAQSAAEKAAQRKQKPIEEKESFRWLAGYRTGCAVATACPQTQIIVASDSESDIYECIVAGQQPAAEGQRKADWIIRACQDRAVVLGQADKADAASAVRAALFAQVAARPVLHRLTLEVSKRAPKSHDKRKRKQPRSARKAVVTVQAASLTLRGPDRPGGKQADVAVNAVLLREENPPAGEPAIEWLLLTNLPIDTVERVLLVVEYYCCRWQIEIYFRVLKSGCRVESSQLETAEAFQPYLALCMIVAWRVMYLMMLGRECPELPADVVLEKDEWQAVYAVVKGEEPPAAAPPLAEMVKLIASLGGYLGRPSDGPPGPKTMWVGMQRMTDLTLGWRARACEAKPSKDSEKAGAGQAPTSPVPSARDPTTVQRSWV